MSDYRPQVDIVGFDAQVGKVLLYRTGDGVLPAP
jgi:hypothetical protein